VYCSLSLSLSSQAHIAFQFASFKLLCCDCKQAAIYAYELFIFHRETIGNAIIDVHHTSHSFQSFS